MYIHKYVYYYIEICIGWRGHMIKWVSFWNVTFLVLGLKWDLTPSGKVSINGVLLAQIANRQTWVLNFNG